MSSSQSPTPPFLIDLATQAVFPLAELPNHVPRRRGGKRLHISTGFRWAKHGVQAQDSTLVRLPTLQVAGTKCTSTEAFQWFCDRLSAGGDSAPPTPRGGRARRRELAKVDRELDRMGS